MASYSFSNISPVEVGALKLTDYGPYEEKNLSNIKDDDLNTWGRMKTSTTTIPVSEKVGFRLYFNFSTMPNGKVLPDNATISSWGIYPQSVSWGSSQYHSSSYSQGLGILILGKYSSTSNDEDNGFVVEELKSVASGDGSNRYFHIKQFANTYYWYNSTEAPASGRSFDIQNDSRVQRKFVELVGFSNDSQLAITPQNLKATDTLPSGTVVGRLVPTITMYNLYGSSQSLSNNPGFGLNEVYSNISVTLPEIRVNAEKEAPYGHDFTITGSGGDNNWSWNEETQVGTITTDEWGGSTQSDITLTASNIPADCYFDGWYHYDVKVSSNMSYSFQPTEYTVLKAVVKENPVVNFSATQGGALTVYNNTTHQYISSGDSVAINTSITVNITTPDPMYYFYRYYLGGEEVIPESVDNYSFDHTVTDNTDIYAEFYVNPIITLMATDRPSNADNVEVSFTGEEGDWHETQYSINNLRPSTSTSTVTFDCYARDGAYYYSTGEMEAPTGVDIKYVEPNHYQCKMPTKATGIYDRINVLAYRGQKRQLTYFTGYVPRNGSIEEPQEGGSTIQGPESGSYHIPGVGITLRDYPHRDEEHGYFEWYAWMSVNEYGQLYIVDDANPYTFPMPDYDHFLIGATYEWPSIQVHQYNKTQQSLPEGHGCKTILDYGSESEIDLSDGAVHIIPPGEHTITLVPSNNFYAYAYTDIYHEEEPQVIYLEPSQWAAGNFTRTIYISIENNKSFEMQSLFGRNQYITIDVAEHTPGEKQAVSASGKFRILEGKTTLVDYTDNYSGETIRPGKTITIEAEDNWSILGHGNATGFFHSIAIEGEQTILDEKFKIMTVGDADSGSITGEILFTGIQIQTPQLPCAYSHRKDDALSIVSIPDSLYTNRITKHSLYALPNEPSTNKRSTRWIRQNVLPTIANKLNCSIDELSFCCYTTGTADCCCGWKNSGRNSSYSERFTRLYPEDGGAPRRVRYSRNLSTGVESWQESFSTYYETITSPNNFFYCTQLVINGDSSPDVKWLPNECVNGWVEGENKQTLWYIRNNILPRLLTELKSWKSTITFENLNYLICKEYSSTGHREMIRCYAWEHTDNPCTYDEGNKRFYPTNNIGDSVPISNWWMYLDTGDEMMETIGTYKSVIIDSLYSDNRYYYIFRNGCKKWGEESTTLFDANIAYNNFQKSELHYRFDHWNQGGTESTANPYVQSEFGDDSCIKSEWNEYTFSVDAYYRQQFKTKTAIHSEYPNAGTTYGDGLYDVTSQIAGGSGQAQIAINAMPNEGYTFRDWLDETWSPISTEASYYGFITEDRIFTARFYHEFLLTILAIDEDDSSIEAGTTTGGGMHTVGESVEINVSPFEWYLFNEWQDTHTWEQPRTIVMPAEPSTIYARCKPKSKLVYEGDQSIYEKYGGNVNVKAVYQGNTEIELKLR